MARSFLSAAVAAVLIAAFSSAAAAHFAMVIPSDGIVSQGEPREISLDVMFIHPFEGHYMDMARPAAFGVMARGQKQDLLGSLAERKAGGSTAWKASYEITRPGDHVFYLEPAPYFEPAEDIFIVHYTKAVVNAFGLEQGWDEEVGLKTEIVPLTRPYGLWAGNVFQGVVKVDGTPVPNALVEVEYYNRDGKVQAPADPFVTQVVKADGQGVFTYAMPREGWWGFAALSEAKEKMARPDGKEYPVEIGALLWVNTSRMR